MLCTHTHTGYNTGIVKNETHICDSKDGPWGYDAKWNKSERDK